MERPGNEKLAVLQTPYSAVPEPFGILERIAGATTDMQYLIHQGFTHQDATFWVGANALLRKRALEAIAVVGEERGFKITRYIHDRTVIEDTESSVDLIDQNWRLHNYPERLSYSATPPDFGSLLIQRRRWSNGGLIILPKLICYLFRGIFSFKKLKESFMRIHYLISIAGVNFGLLLLLVYPFEDNLRSMGLPLTALPYYFIYGRDLLQAGYKLKDIFRVYTLNLMLIPIHLGGVCKSIHQMLTGKKTPFQRTPKIRGKTRTPLFYLVAEYLILISALVCWIVGLITHHWLHAVFAFFTFSCFLYAIIHFIGLKESKETLRVPFGPLFQPASKSKVPVA